MTNLVRLTTPLGSDVLRVEKVSLKEELGRLSEYQLDLISEQGDIDLDKLMGKPITIHLETNGDPRHFNAYVSRISQGGRRGRYFAYRLIARPWLWFLTLTRDCRMFQDMKVPEILAEIFDEHSQISAYESELTDEYGVWDYCVQYRESDFDFVSRLMEHEGIYYYFKHTDGKHTLVLCDGPSPHDKAKGCDKLLFVPIDGAVRPDVNYAWDWTLNREIQPGAFALTDYDFEKPSVDLQSRRKIVNPHALAEFEVYDYPGEYIVPGDGELYTRTRIEEMHARYERTSGKTNAHALAVGHLFMLEKHPRPDQNVDYLVVSTDIVATNPHVEAGGVTDSTFSCDFTALNSRAPFRSERSTPKPKVLGLQTAIVTGASGQDIFCDKYGRIKVSFHWDRYDKRDDKSSCWIRVSQNWGGKNWGGMFIPHVGQEVIVQFLEGDPDRPIVTGRVYNAEQMPPVELPAGKTQSIIRDHGGNEIKLEGADGTQQIKIHSPFGNTTFAMGAPHSPGNGIWAATDLFYKMTVGQDWDELTKGSKFEVVQNEKREHIIANSYKWFDADAFEVVRGHKDSAVQGFKTERILGYEQKTVGGFNLTTIVGSETKLNFAFKNDIIAGLNTKMFKGGLINIDSSSTLGKSPKVFEAIGQAARKIGREIRDYEFIKIKSGVAKEVFEDLTQKIGKWGVKVQGVCDLETGGGFNVKAGGHVNVDTSMATFMGNVDVMKDVGVFGDSFCFGSVFVAKK